MSFVYLQTEPSLWTVGTYDGDGRFQPESDHGSPDEAAERVRWLNGGSGCDCATETAQLRDEVAALRELLAQTRADVGP